MAPSIRALTLGLCLTSAYSHAASISGTVSNTQSQPLAGVQVRLWKPGPKGWVIDQSTSTSASGAYTFTSVPAGTYKVDARMGPGVSGNYGDRWYDVAPPNGNGYVSSDADELLVADPDTLTGIDLVLEVLGGFDGMVHANGVPMSGALVRGEIAADPRIHHTDQSQSGPHLGRFYMRGMVPASDYRFLVCDQNGMYEVLVAEPYATASGSNTVLPTFSLQAMPADPNEPNDDSTVPTLDSSIFRTSPPGTYHDADGIIGPRNQGDVDWYCFDALAGDRFLITVASTVTVAGGGIRANPFADPVLSFWTGDGTTKLLEDDDSGPFGRGALIDTGVIATNGRYCAVVSTYGDTTFTGMSQGSAGRYALTIEMGNRRPGLAVTSSGSPVPEPPAALTLDEGQSITFELAFSDPDADPLDVKVLLRDNAAVPITMANIPAGTGTGQWAWTASQTAAAAGPYTAVFTAADAEFTETIEVVIQVNAVNLTPTVPVHVSPADGATLDTSTPTLVVQNATDGDGDPLQYEFELYLDGETTPAQTQLVPGGAGGQTSWQASPLPENARVTWRVRAYDGQADSPYSAWSMPWAFFVDEQNDPPAAPDFLKPENDDEVMVRRPALSASNPGDPEGDAVELVFQLASDAAFTQDLIESPAIPANTAAPSTTWNVPQDLPWGSIWYARAYARDDRGGTSPMSDVHAFSIKPNAAPAAPTFGEPFAAQCRDLMLPSPTLDVIVVNTVTDPELEPVSIQLQVLPFEGDPDMADPLFDRTVDQPTDVTTVSFDVSTVPWTEDTRYRVRARAFDGTDASDWSECDLRINAEADPGNGGDGGTGGDGNGNGDGDGPGSVKTGCGCSQGVDLAALGMFALAGLALRRRRRTAP